MYASDLRKVNMSRNTARQHEVYSRFTKAMHDADRENLYGLLACFMLREGLDPTLFGLNATTVGKVLSAMGLLKIVPESPAPSSPPSTATASSESIQSSSKTEDAVSVVNCIESLLEVPAIIREALEAVGVETDLLTSLYFDPKWGPEYRQRIRSKYTTFVYLVSSGKIRNPNGYFRDMVRKGWPVSRSYDPNWKAVKRETAAVQGAVENAAMRAEPVRTEFDPHALIAGMNPELYRKVYGKEPPQMNG